MKQLLAAILAAAALAASPARADLGLQLKAGTLGLGLAFWAGFGEALSVGLGVNWYDYTGNRPSGNVDYDYTLELRSAALLANYHPFTGHFHISGGVLYNNNELVLTGRPGPGGTFNLNGVSYPAAQVGRLTGTVSARRIAPYVGIGWGNRPNSIYGLSLDFGVLYQGTPDVSLSATGALSNPALAADLERERQNAESDLSRYKWYPVASVGYYIRF